MAVGSRPNFASPAELCFPKMEPARDAPRHRSTLGVHSGDQPGAASWKATAAPNNAVQPRAQPGDPNLPAKREVQVGLGSTHCAAQRHYLHHGEFVATLPTEAPLRWRWEPPPVRALEAQDQA